MITRASASSAAEPGQQAVDYGSGAAMASAPFWLANIESVIGIAMALAGFVLVCLRIYITVRQIRERKDGAKTD